jgi:multicomponent Na+:H+ antiporter subunit B
VSQPGRRASVLIFWLGALGLGLVFTVGALGLPDVGEVPHPYAARAIPVAVAHDTGNVIGSVTFDQRGFDTLGEEFILLTAAVGSILLLRRKRDEDEDAGVEHEFGPEDVFEAVRLVGVALLPVTLLVGAYIVVHGTVSPGGGFQGGVILATAVHLAYLAGDYRTLEQLRPLGAFDVGEAVAAGAYVVIGLVGLLAGGSFLINFMPQGVMGELQSGGTVLLLNITVGIEVGCAFTLLVAKFLDQALLVNTRRGSER